MWKILVCDDDRVFLESFKKVIRKVAGEWIAEINTFEGKDNLEFYVGEHPDDVCIILMAVNLDEGSGIEAAKHILAVQPEDQIIFMSGYDNYYLDVYAVDHAYFLKKPISEDALVNALKRAGERIEDVKRKGFVVTNKKEFRRFF